MHTHTFTHRLRTHKERERKERVRQLNSLSYLSLLNTLHWDTHTRETGRLMWSTSNTTPIHFLPNISLLCKAEAPDTERKEEVCIGGRMKNVLGQKDTEPQGSKGSRRQRGTAWTKENVRRKDIGRGKGLAHIRKGGQTLEFRPQFCRKYLPKEKWGGRRDSTKKNWKKKQG